MARYTNTEFSVRFPNGLRMPFDTQASALASAARAVKDGVADWVNTTRRDSLGRVSYVGHVERPRQTANT